MTHTKIYFVHWGPLECEAKAMEGVTFAWDTGFCDIVFECDSKVVSDSINRYCESPATIGNIIDGIRHMLKDFQQVLVSHVRRQGNCPAHLLAQHIMSVVSFVIWIEENPTFIELALIQDVLFLSSS